MFYSCYSQVMSSCPIVLRAPLPKCQVCSLEKTRVAGKRNVAIWNSETFHRMTHEYCKKCLLSFCTCECALPPASPDLFSPRKVFGPSEKQKKWDATKKRTEKKVNGLECDEVFNWSLIEKCAMEESDEKDLEKRRVLWKKTKTFSRDPRAIPNRLSYG